MINTPYFIGVDGGGTKCKATLFNAEFHPIANGIAGPANVSRMLTLAQQSIVDAVEIALREAGENPKMSLKKLPVFAGLAGANITSASHALGEWQHPFKSFQFTSDLQSAACGAHGGKDGAVLIVGTGSCAAAIKNKDFKQFGGYGFLLGDKGSGAWLGRSLVIKALECVDGILTKTELIHQLFAAVECASAEQLVDTFKDSAPAHFAQLAPMIIKAADNGDIVGHAIVSEAADYLNVIADQALQYSGGSLALVGGVASAIKPWLDTAIQARCTAPMHSPEWGAAYYFQTGENHG